MNKLISLTFIGLILALFSCHSIVAPGPNYHLWDLEESLLLEPDALITQIINENYDACLCGLTYADVGIFEYYTNFKLYAGLHNYNVPDEILKIARNDRDRAFAYCWKIHLATDAISHNYFVPAEIRKTKLPNVIIHPIKELKIESDYLNPISNHMMEIHEEFDDLVEQATGRDWSGEAEKLNQIIGGGQFYEEAYAPESSTSWGKFQNSFYKFIGNFVNDKSAIDMERLTIEESRKILRGETPNLDPSGEESLRQADRDTQMILYLITIFSTIIIFYLGFRWNVIGFSKNKFRMR